MKPEQHKFTWLAKKFLWADSAFAVDRVVRGLMILCAVLFVLDLVAGRHAYVPGEGIPGFYAFVGFIAFTLIVLGAKQLRRLILRNEQYYAPYSVDAEDYPDAGLERLGFNPDSAHGSATDSDVDAGARSGASSGEASQQQDMK